MKQVFDWGYEYDSVFYPDEEVWCSPQFDGCEWNTEDEMRRDMLIHILCEEFDYVRRINFSECETEEGVECVFSDINDEIAKE